jgi:peptidoglycan DL-endopeptidase CwlO
VSDTSRSRPRQARVAALVVAPLIFITGAAGFVAVAGSAAADPTQSIPAVQKQVTELQHQAEAATEKYNGTRERLKSAAVMAQATATRLRQQNHNVQVAREVLGRLAVETYKAGSLQTLSLLLDDTGGRALAAEQLRTTLTDRQAEGVARLAVEQARLATDQAEAAQQQKQLTAAAGQLDTLKAQVTTKLAAAQALLSRLDGSQRAALLTVSRSLDGRALAVLGVQVPASGKLTCKDVGIESPNARTKIALDFACAQLGKAYVWGGDGPNVFDCSGLTLRAWEAAGVSLPHFAADQAQAGSRVPIRSVLPGDLIFFGSNFTHMGMYLGKSLMIHAPHSGDVVRIAPARLESVLVAVRL